MSPPVLPEWLLLLHLNALQVSQVMPPPVVIAVIKYHFTKSYWLSFRKVKTSRVSFHKAESSAFHKTKHILVPLTKPQCGFYQTKLSALRSILSHSREPYRVCLLLNKTECLLPNPNLECLLLNRVECLLIESSALLSNPSLECLLLNIVECLLTNSSLKCFLLNKVDCLLPNRIWVSLTKQIPNVSYQNRIWVPSPILFTKLNRVSKSSTFFIILSKSQAKSNASYQARVCPLPSFAQIN